MSPDLLADLTLDAVIARHPGIPGLARALDPEEGAALAAAAGVIAGGVAAHGDGARRRDAYEVSRIRLKRDRSVSVALRPIAGAGPWLLVRALRPADWATKAAKDLRVARERGLIGAAYAGDALLVVPAAADRALALQRLARLGLRLEGVGPQRDPDPSHPGEPWGEPEAVPRGSHWGNHWGNPEQDRGGAVSGGRLRARGDDLDGAPGVLRAARTLSYNPARRWVGVAASASAGGPRRLLRLHAGARRPHLEPYVEGIPLDVTRLSSDEAEELRRTLGAGLSGRGAPPRGRDEGLSAALDRVASGLADLHPRLGERARAVVRRLGEHPQTLGRRVPAHGDLSPDQVIRGDDGDLHVIDWDRWGWWPCGWDSATWTAQAVLEGVAEPNAPALLTEDEPAPAVLAAAALLRSPDPFRRMRADWPAATLRLLDHAEGVLG